MKLNLDAIRGKIAELNGENRTSNSSNVQLWKPDVGEYVVRGMHWPTHLKLTRDGEPFVERHFYYGIGRRGILAPAQFGKEDPIANLRIQLFKSGNPDDKIIAKKLFARMRCYMPVVVKDGPNSDPENVLVWSFGTQVYEKLLSYFLKDDIGDYLDPKEGFNLEIKISKKGGKQFFDTDVELARRPSALAESDAKIQELFEKVPDISSMWSERTTAQIQQDLDAWLNGGEVSDNSEGTEKSNGKSENALDKLVDDVKEEVKEEKAAKSSKKVEKKSEKKETKKADKDPVSELDDDSEDNSSGQDDLDSAFEELMED